MKANEFVKEHGWDKVKSIVINFNYNSSNKFIVNLNNNSAVSIYDLKRLVESHDLVEKYKNRHGGIRFRIRWGQFRHGDTQEYNDRLKQAIIDVESCQ